MHAENILRRQNTSATRVQNRLAARNKVKSSRCLHMCPYFATLEDASVSQIVDVMQYRVEKAGKVLCHQGDEADQMFVIVEGECMVYIHGAMVAVLKGLDVFGESAMFPDANGACVRSATVTVSAESVQLLVLHKADLERLIVSGVLNPGCVQALTKVAEKRRLENSKRDEVDREIE